ncbi:MAG: inositol monophosphatase [Bacteroidales bacterium]|nr:inositol monophosphatase [Bacteroidales bacterium]
MIDPSSVNQIHQLLRKVGAFQIEQQKSVPQSKIDDKSKNNFVTFVDKESEEQLIENLHKLFPGTDFIAEERGGQLFSSKPTWIIDPLDGTTNYIHQIPVFSISIALMIQKNLVAGFIYHPHADEFFYAIRDNGAFLNDSPIHVTHVTLLKDSLWATGFPTHDFPLLDGYLNFIKYSIQHTHGLRRLGSAAIDLAWVSAGRLDGFFEYGLSPWDVAAGAILVQEAGGIVTDFSGNSDFLEKKEIIATNPFLFKEFFENFKTLLFD